MNTADQNTARRAWQFQVT